MCGLGMQNIFRNKCLLNNKNIRGKIMQGIDGSLDLLKQLEAKLKRKPQQTRMQTQNHLEHTPLSTNYNKKSARSPPATMAPIYVDTNQNQYSNVQQIIKQNRRLKKYANCLLQMNDYLKNQLVKKDQYSASQCHKMGHSFEFELMRMQIEYLKQMNRDKELQLKKSLYISERQASKIKNKEKHKKIQSLGDFYYNKSKSHYNSQPSNTRSQHTKSLYSSSVFKTNKGEKLNQKVRNTKKGMKKIQGKKCRLCYI